MPALSPSVRVVDSDGRELSAIDLGRIIAADNADPDQAKLAAEALGYDSVGEARTNRMLRQTY